MPAPRDAAGYAIDESASMATVLMKNFSVPAEDLLEENVARDTVGNLWYVRLLHTDPRRLRRLALVTSDWHLPRVRAIAEHVFSLPFAADGADPGYELEYHGAASGLPDDVLRVRRAKEEAQRVRFEAGSAWRAAHRTMREFHAWLNTEHLAYAPARLRSRSYHAARATERMSGALLASYAG